MNRTIYIEGRFTAKRLTGVQRYATEIVRALDRLIGEMDVKPHIVLIRPEEGSPLGLANIEERVVASGTGHFWTQYHFAKASRGGVALSLAASGPLFHLRQVVVIHDAAVFRFPELYSKTYAMVHRCMDKILARTAHIATVSNFSKGELAKFLRLRPAQILVAPNGAEHLKIEPDLGVIERLGLTGRPFFLALGSLNPNKNLAVTIRALNRIARQDVLLVAVGDLNKGVFGKFQIAQNDSVILPGRLDDDEVAGLMQHAKALIFPSIYEGFGIPPLEAISQGCPVLASTADAIREVCVDAAEYFEPHDDAQLAQLMGMVLADDGTWREALLTAGARRLTYYSWESSARDLLAACQEREKI